MHRHVKEEAEAFAVLGQIHDTRLDGALRRSDLEPGAIENDLAGPGGVGAEDQPRQLGATRPDKSCNAENLAATQRQRAIVHAPAVADPPHLEEGRLPVQRIGPRLLLVEAGEVAPDHHPHQTPRRQLGAGDRSDIGPIAQHRDAIGKAGDFRHPVTDVDNCEAAFAQPLDQLEEPLRLCEESAAVGSSMTRIRTFE